MNTELYYWIQKNAVECKGIGSLCLLLGSCCFALCLNQSYNQRNHQLIHLYSLLLQFKNELHYECNPLPECFQHMGQVAKGPFQTWFMNLHKAMEDQRQSSFGKVWKQELVWLENNCALTKEDLYPIYELGIKLENGEVSIKMQGIDYALLHLEKQRKEYEMKLGQKKKISTTFCIFASMLVLILLL